MITPSRVKKLQFEIYFYIYYYLTKDWESSQNKRTKVFQRRTTFQTKYKKSNSGFARRKHVSMLIEQNILYATITLVLYNYSAQENFIKNKSISEEWNNSVFFLTAKPMNTFSFGVHNSILTGHLCKHSFSIPYPNFN